MYFFFPPQIWKSTTTTSICKYFYGHSSVRCILPNSDSVFHLFHGTEGLLTLSTVFVKITKQIRTKWKGAKASQLCQQQVGFKLAVKLIDAFLDTDYEEDLLIQSKCLDMASSPPCWRTLTKYFLLTYFVVSSNMASMCLSSHSLGKDCNRRIVISVWQSYQICSYAIICFCFCFRDVSNNSLINIEFEDLESINTM
jgi:hypothetical protein